MDAPRVSVIILTFNNVDYTKLCIESLLASTLAPFELIVIDNGSTDATRPYLTELQTRLPQEYCQIVMNDHNCGFAQGNNQGAELARGAYIAFLNNDTIVPEGCLDGLLRAITSDPQAGATGPRSNNVGGAQILTDVSYDSIETYHRAAVAHAHAHRGVYLPCWRLVGFCLLTKRDLFLNEYGGFPQIYGIGNYEDTDYCLWLATKGYHNYVAQEVFVHHFGSQSFSKNNINADSWLLRNGRVFAERWRPLKTTNPLVEEALAYAERQEALIAPPPTAVLLASAAIDNGEITWNSPLGPRWMNGKHIPPNLWMICMDECLPLSPRQEAIILAYTLQNSALTTLKPLKLRCEAITPGEKQVIGVFPPGTLDLQNIDIRRSERTLSQFPPETEEIHLPW